MSGGLHRLTEPGKVRLETCLGPFRPIRHFQRHDGGPWTVRGWRSALPLLMLGILADHHHATLAADDLAFVANALHTGSNLHFQRPP